MEWRFLVFLMELLSSFISFVVGYYAMKGYRTSSARELFLLYLGFIILGTGTFLRAVTSAYFTAILRTVDLPAPHLQGLLNLAGFLYTLSQIIAYGLFAAAYVLQGKNMGERNVELGVAVSAAAFGIYRLFFIPQLELIAIPLLGFVSVHSFINWRLRRNSGAALVFFGFSFMLLSHLLFLFMIVEEMLLFLGQITQLIGFLCLLAMLARVSKTNG